MKKFLKKASIYLIFMLILTVLLFGLNHYYGSRLAEDLKTNIQKAAEDNDYQIRNLKLEANPLFQQLTIERLMLNKAQDANIDIVDAEIKLSWQQIFHYIKNNDLALHKDYKAEIYNLKYSDLENEYRLNFKDAVFNYSGEFKIEDLEDIEYLLKNNHNIVFTAEELVYDYPYYRSYGITADSWENLSTFTELRLKGDYQSESRVLRLDELILNGEFINYEADLKAEIMEFAKETEQSSAGRQNELIFKTLELNYLLDFNGDGLETEENQYYKSLSFDDYSFKAYIDIFLEDQAEMLYTANQFDSEMKLNNFNLTFNEELSNKINESTFGIFAKDNQFSLKIDSFDFEQEYTNPAGNTESTLVTPFVNSELEANYSYNREDFYLDNALIKIKPRTVEAETLFNFMQLILDRQFSQDEEGYYLIRLHGELGNLELN